MGKVAVTGTAVRSHGEPVPPAPTYPCRACGGPAMAQWGRGSYCKGCQAVLRRQGRRLRAALYEQVRTLQARGYTRAQIAAMFGCKVASVTDLLADPTGARADARRAAQRGTCADCGGPTSPPGRAGPATRCDPCYRAAQHAGRLWPPERVIAAFQEFYAVHGRPPQVADASLAHAAQREARAARHGGPHTPAYHDVPLPRWDHIRHDFGSWAAALRAAGLPWVQGEVGRYDRTVETRRRNSVPRHYWSHADIAAAIRRWQAAHGAPPCDRDWRQPPAGYPSGTTVRRRYGTWAAALAAALADDS